MSSTAIISYVGTLGTIISGAISALIPAVGTIGTILSGALTASIIGGQLQDVATLGTILSPAAVVVGSVAGINNYTASISGTIKASQGLFYGIVVTQEGTILGAPGTVIIYNYGAGSASASILGRVIAPSSDTTGFLTSLKPVTFGTLVASVLGTLLYTAYFE